MPTSVQRERWRLAWDKHAKTCDRQMRFSDRFLFKDSRSWICSQAQGDVLEVAMGTGLNLPLYPPDARLTGIDVSAAMLDITRRRAAELGRDVDLRLGDAEALEIPDVSFDTVVCTFSLCAIPDHKRALAEMRRVLRPGGLLLLADHVASSARLARGVQRLVEVITVPMAGEHYLRRPMNHVKSAGFDIERHDRFKLGVVERLAARKLAS